MGTSTPTDSGGEDGARSGSVLVGSVALRLARRVLGCNQRDYCAAIEFRRNDYRFARSHSGNGYRRVAGFLVFTAWDGSMELHPSDLFSGGDLWAAGVPLK